MLKAKCIILLSLFSICITNLVSAQVKDTLSKKNDTITTPIRAVRIDSSKKKVDTLKEKYVNPGKIAGRKAIFKSLIIPGWGQLYNNQLLVDDLNAKGEKTGHFWQKSYTLGKIGLIYTGFTLLTLSYIESDKNYKIFLKEAQFRAQNPSLKQNPDLTRYDDANILNAQAIYKRNRQIVIFSYFAVYGINVIDAYVAARLHYFNIDDSLSFKISPTLINNPNTMYGFNGSPALKLSLRF